MFQHVATFGIGRRTIEKERALEHPPGVLKSEFQHFWRMTPRHRRRPTSDALHCTLDGRKRSLLTADTVAYMLYELVNGHR